MSNDDLSGSGGRMRLPRTRGAISGVALIVLGLWGGLAPFIGPYLDFAFTPQPNNAWHWTAARGWFEVLPGAAALVGGLILLLSANRAMTLFGAWIAIVAGGWFVVGPEVSPLFTLGSIGSPANGGQREHVAEVLIYFTALGAVIVLFGALAAGRLSVRSVRDVRVAARRDAETHNRAVGTQDREDETRSREDRNRSREDTERTDAAATPAGVAADDSATGPEPAAAREPVAAQEPASATGPAPARTSDDQTVATSQNPAAPYAPDGHTPEAAEPPTDAPQPGGPAYSQPQRYVRAQPSEQIPVEQLRRDHPPE